MFQWRGILLAFAIMVMGGSSSQNRLALATSAQQSATQKPMWWTKLDVVPDRPTTAAGYPDFALDERNAYILKQGQIVARELTTGRTLWRAQASRQVLADGSRVFTFSSTRLVALDARSGRTVWSVRYDHPYLSSTSLPHGLCLCLSVSKDLLLGYGIAIDAKTGATRWKVSRANLWGSDEGLVGATESYVVWQVYSSGGASSRDIFRVFQRSDGQERSFGAVGEYIHTSQSLGIDAQGRFVELFVPFKEPLSSLPLELRAYDLSTATARDTYGKFDVNPRPGCLWTVEANALAYRLIGRTPESIVLATQDSCGKYAVVIPSSLEGPTRTVELPLNAEARQELLGESRAVAVARIDEHLIQIAVRSGEVAALFDQPLRLESLIPEDGRVRASRDLQFPTERTAGKDVTWMRARLVVVANGDTVSVYLNN